MGDTRIMRAVRTGMIRRDGGTRLIVKKGVSTAHEGAEIVKSHPHLWEPIEVDFPVEGGELTDAAVEAAGTSHTEALRSILNGLAERGYEVDAESREDVPGALVALVFSVIDHPRGGGVPALGEGEPGDVVYSGAGRAYRVGVTDGGWKTYTPVDGGEPGEAGPDDTISQGAAADVDAGDQGVPADVVDPTTKEGRQAIRAWAREQDDDDLRVSDSGPLPQHVVDAWAHAQGGRA